MKRFYAVQWCHPRKGWLDLPSLASTKEKEAIDNMASFQEQRAERLAMRVIRKPHGWEPTQAPEDEEPPGKTVR